MESMPDIIGYELDEALKICRDRGCQVEIVFTQPDKWLPGGKQRVVRFKKVSNNKGVITAANEAVVKGGGS